MCCNVYLTTIYRNIGDASVFSPGTHNHLSLSLVCQR
ncbi:hypothetical protein CSUI_005422 [Cystoisospora suis]|uniref:Uncharacterized protein n=1 Tax=Cystoisospora suis TaxID=483139 RepID=A0A2C6KJR1_9APIC|nr:hypothetical protein CSUI_005422 [Cystoisospora suis]